MTLNRFIQFCGVLITLFSLSLIYGFIRSEAWFGVMIALFVVAVGIKAIAQPDIIRLGAPEPDNDSRP